MKKIDFDKVIERRGTGCGKWDGLGSRFGVSEELAKEIIPMWVADTDFMVAPEIGAAVKKAVEFELYGYKFGNPKLADAVVHWQKKRFDFDVNKDHITTSCGVVAVVTTGVQAFTQPGDGVVIQSPVYYPFADSITNNGRNIIEAPLVETVKEDGTLYYTIDFDVFEAACAREDAKLFILCSPHNPLGRVWTVEELKKMAAICKKHNVYVLSDEIHGDIIMSGHKFVPMLKAVPDCGDYVMMTMAASKTFNVAGLQCCYAIIPNADKLAQFKAVATRNRLPAMGTVGSEALVAAYTEAEYYVDEFNEYVEGNFNYMVDFVKKNLPKVRIVKPEGTYLIWLDISAMLPEGADVNKFMCEQARVAIDPGYWFGKGYEGYIRMNAATQRSRIEESMKRLAEALNKAK